MRKVLVGLALLIIGCTSSSTIVRDPNFSGKISQVLVELKGSDDMTQFLSTVANNLHFALRKSGIKSKVYVHDQLSLNNPAEEISNIKVTFKPKFQLSLTLTKTDREAVSFGNGGHQIVLEGFFDLIINELQGTKEVWSTQVSVTANEEWGFISGNELSNKIIKLLKSDNLI